GSSARAVVPDGDDRARVVGGYFWGASQNPGRVCTAIKRFYVDETVYEPIVSGLIAKAKAVKVGNGLEPGSELGPINNKMQFEKVLGMVDAARKSGAKIETGGAPSGAKGYFLPPTIITNARAGMVIVDEEQFG